MLISSAAATRSLQLGPGRASQRDSSARARRFQELHGNHSLSLGFSMWKMGESGNAPLSQRHEMRTGPSTQCLALGTAE